MIAQVCHTGSAEERILSRAHFTDSVVATEATGVVMNLSSSMRETVSHYRIVRPLGRGGMGEVYLAEDTKLGRLVALKLLNSEAARDPRRVQRFLREAHAASRLNHPNIAVTHEVGQTEDGLPFIAMEHVEGQTLADLIGDKPLEPKRIVDLGVEIADALDQAREKGIVHRDLKPANIMISPRGHAKVLDFGLAKLTTTTPVDTSVPTDMLLSDPGIVMGTVHYMSPEQALGHEVDHRSDLFSFGVLLYQMATARLPFGGGNASEITARIINSQPEAVARWNYEVPPELERIIRKCLEKDPEWRYQTARDIVVDLNNLDRDSRASRQAILPRSRWPGLPAVAALALLFTILLGIWAIRSRRPEPAPPAARQTSTTAAAVHPRLSIAVLPLQNLSADPSHGYFAGGLHDEILTQLSRVAALKVISRTSVMGYAGPAVPRLKQIASELGVGSIVEGSVQVVGDRLRVNVQLIDAASDEHLWATRYDRTLDDAFAVQSDIASQIVAAVGATLSASEHDGMAAIPTANPAAYRLYLQARESMARPGWLQQNLEAAEQLLDRAIALDPAFALAHANLSHVHGAMYHLRHDPSPARAARMNEEVETALRLAPHLPQAHHAKGMAHYYVRRDYQKALHELAVARDGLPNDAAVLVSIGLVLRRMGNWDEALSMLEKATSLNPRDSRMIVDLGGLTNLVMHRYSDAIRAFDQAMKITPDLHSAAVLKAQTLFHWRGELNPLRDVLARVPGETSLGAFGTVFGQRAALLLRERQPERLLESVAASEAEVYEGIHFFHPSALYAGWAHRLRGDAASAQRSFESALALLDASVRELPDDWRVHAARGLTLAALQRRSEALEEVRWIERSQVYTADALSGPAAAEARAAILAQAGAVDETLDEIERRMNGPSWLSAHSLQRDPLWDPIRTQPRFLSFIARRTFR